MDHPSMMTDPDDMIDPCLGSTDPRFIDNFVDVFSTSQWKLDAAQSHPILRSEIEAALREGRLDETPYIEMDRPFHMERDYHIERIAYLVSQETVDPIEISVIYQENDSPDLHVVDGNHRLCAAIFRGDRKIGIRFERADLEAIQGFLGSVLETGEPDVEEVFSVLNDHLGAGESGFLGQLQMMSIMEHIPEECRKNPGPLWRGMLIPRSVLDDLSGGREVYLARRSFSFWSKSQHEALAILRERTFDQTHVGVLLSHMHEDADIGLDIEAFYRFHDRASLAYPGWSFASKEQEVIIHDHGKPFCIHPSDVHQVFESHAALMKPAIGERIMFDDGESDIIQSISTDQGRDLVQTARGSCTVRWTKMGWSCDEMESEFLCEMDLNP